MAASGNVPLDADDNAGVSDLDAESVAFTGVAVLDEPGLLRLSCHAAASSFVMRNLVINAIQVASLEDQSPTGPIT